MASNLMTSTLKWLQSDEGHPEHDQYDGQVTQVMVGQLGGAQFGPPAAGCHPEHGQNTGRVTLVMVG